MRILIVNAYNNCPQGNNDFQIFKNLIVKYFNEQRELVDTENEFFVRDKDTIEDFLYEIESSYVRHESAHRFDQLDLIFMTGDPCLRPWAPSMRKILTLFRMCFKVNKLLFAVSIGMQALVYLAASNIEKDIPIINGSHGGNIQELKQIHKIRGRVQQNDFFLENTTGDLYQFHYESSEWIPRANVGMHYRKAAQEFQSIGKYIVKAPVYKPKEFISQQGMLYKNKNNETITEIKKTHYHHWALIDMQSKFLTPLRNTWDCHSFAFTNQEKQFVCLADSDEGPSIIEFKSFLACMFEIDPKYPETLKIVKNFIINSLRQIKSHKQHSWHESILKFHHQVKETTLDQQLKKSHQGEKVRRALQLMKSRPKTGIQMEYVQETTEENQELKHVGFSVKKDHMPSFLRSNAVNNKGLKVQTNAKTPRNNQREVKSPEKENPFVVNPQTAFPETPQASTSGITQKDVRLFLHPHISEQCLNNQHLWVPGNLSRVSKRENRAIVLRSTHSSRGFVTSNISTKHSRTPSLIQFPYISQEDIEKRYEKSQNSKIIAHKQLRGFKSSADKIKPNYVSEDYETPKQEFRTATKDKWLSQDFFV